MMPYAQIQNLVVWRRLAAQNCRLPLFWVQKGPKNIQTTINRYEAMYEGCGGLRGGHRSDPSHPPSHVGQAAAPGGLRRPPLTPGSWKWPRKHTHNNQPAGGSVREPPGPAGGHGSVPLRPRPEFSWCRSAGSPKTAAGLSWVKKNNKKNLNNNQLAGGDAWGALRDCRGSRK